MGVDLNRNYDYDFNEITAGNYAGTSDDECDQYYNGKTAFSEKETQAMKNFI